MRQISQSPKNPGREYWAWDRNTFSFTIDSTFIGWVDEIADPVNHKNQWGNLVRPAEWKVGGTGTKRTRDTYDPRSPTPGAKRVAGADQFQQQANVKEEQFLAMAARETMLHDTLRHWNSMRYALTEAYNSLAHAHAATNIKTTKTFLQSARVSIANAQTYGDQVHQGVYARFDSSLDTTTGADEEEEGEISSTQIIDDPCMP